MANVSVCVVWYVTVHTADCRRSWARRALSPFSILFIKQIYSQAASSEAPVPMDFQNFLILSHTPEPKNLKILSNWYMYQKSWDPQALRLMALTSSLRLFGSLDFVKSAQALWSTQMYPWAKVSNLYVSVIQLSMMYVQLTLLLMVTVISKGNTCSCA